MNYTTIYDADTTNGTGVRVVFWTSGCSHHCKECHNPQTWDPENGEKYTKEVEDKIISLLDKPYIRGITLSGGDPLYEGNLKDINSLVKRIKNELPNKDIWIYSGFTWEEIQSDERRREIVNRCDILVDGRFVIEKKNLKLKWRGSSNQNVIDVQKSLSTGKVALYCD